MRLADTNAHGVSTRTSPLTNRPARAAAIGDRITQSGTTRDQAVELLTRMRDGLQGRTGLVRLIHTTRTEGPNMAFESFNKKWGNSTRTLETKAALIAYFDLAGLDKTELNNYLGRITERGHRIQGAEIFRVLNGSLAAQNVAQPQTGSGGERSHRSQALVAHSFPQNIDQPDPDPNKGAQGSLAVVEDLVQPHVDQQNPGPGGGEQNPIADPNLQNPGPSAQPSQPEISQPVLVAQDPSVHDIDDYDSKGNYAPDRRNLAVVNQPVPAVVSNADLQAGNFAMVQPQFTLREAIDNAGVDRSQMTEIGKGGFGKAYEVTRNGEKVVLKVPVAQGDIQKFPLVGLSSLSQKPRLARTNEVTAAYLKSHQISNVCIPTDFLVHITRNGQSSYEVVPAGQDFKKWALAELQNAPRPVIRIAGSIMPKAPGQGLEKLILSTANKPSPLSSADLRSIATTSLQTLRQFADHGFVHGDIKPLNMIYDPAGKQLTFIDTGGLAKISKDPALAERTKFRANRGFTRLYSHPSTLADAKVGHEQDLFSIGLSLLECGLKSSAKTTDWAQASRLVDDLQKSSNPAERIRAELRSKVGNPGPNTLEDLALRLIEISLGEKNAIMPDRLKAILHELDSHAALGGPGLPAVDPDSFKPPRNFTSSQASVERRPPAKKEFLPEDLANPGELVDGRDRGDLMTLKFGVNLDKAEERFTQHLENHAKRELDFFASPGVIAPGRAERVKEFEILANAGPRKIAFEGDNPLEMDFSEALKPGGAPDIDARLQARNLPGIQNLAAILPAFLSNKFMDGLLKDGSPERNAINDFSFSGGPQTSQQIRILEDGTIRIEASRTRKADAIWKANAGSQIGQKIALDPAQSNVTENIVLELRLRPTVPNKPPAAEIVVKNVSYQLNLCRA